MTTDATVSSPPILDQTITWLDEGRQVALATVIETWGSAPQPAGSQLLIDSEGNFEGSVSGGCVEGAVIVEAIEAIEEGEARLLEFGVSDEDAFAVGLACGGTIRVLVEPVGKVLSEQMLAELVEIRAGRYAVAYEVNITTGKRRLVRRKFLYSIAAAWVITVPASAALAATIYKVLQLF